MTAYGRIERRETHSPRSGVAISLAVLLVLASAYLATEVVLAAVGQHPLLAGPAQMVHDLVRLGTVPAPALAASGAVLAVIGLALVIVAVSSGRRARHVVRSDRAAIVIDNEVVASALVRAAANAAGVDPDRVVGSVSHRRAVLRITPSSGLPVDEQSVLAAVRSRLDAWDLSPSLQPKILIEKSGKVGA